VQLDQRFTIPIDIERAWTGLLDVNRVAKAFPGATLAEHGEDSFTGTVKVKLGPVQLSYRGEARFTEIDRANRRISLVASGVDTKGNGTAAADVTAVVSETPDGSTVCELKTTLDITGPAAQFGRGIVVDIGNRVLSQFARNLEKSFLEPEPVAESTPARPPRTVRPVPEATAAGPLERPDEEPLDLGGLVWNSRLGRHALVGLAASILVLVVIAVRGRNAR
jgi:carbon monoxide dehydrogenase subunit G